MKSTNDVSLSNDERMARLVADLKLLAKGWRPGQLMLAACPIIERWHWTTYPGSADPALTGIVCGHPILADGRPIVTSPVLACDLTGRWARTASRFYRLGRPLADV
jgi:hypothetical protein